MLPFAATPPITAQALPVGSPVPVAAPAPLSVLESAPVETFDPVARASLLAQDLPRRWSGSYQPFGGAAAVPAQLQLTSLVPMGQMLVLQGSLSIAGVSAPVQGNLNAKSDQLNLVLVGGQRIDGLESGGFFQGLEGLALSSWVAPRLTNPGGRLQLQAGGSSASRPEPSAIRGLW